MAIGSVTKAYGRPAPSFIRASEIPPCGNLLSTGCPALDGLMGEMRGGQLYLFCGGDSDGSSRFVDDLVHRLMARACRSGKVAYMNSTDYYSGKTILSSDRLAFYAKAEGMEPHRVLEGIYFAAAYSEGRQPKAAAALEEMIRREGGTKLVVAHRMPVFYEGADDRAEAREALNRSVSALWRTAAEGGMVMVATAICAGGPFAFTSSLMSDLASVMVSFRGSGESWTAATAAQIHATLLKHPSKRTPATASICEGGEGLGRITPPFRQDYQLLLERLRKGYAGMLREPRDRDAFESLLRDAWDREHAAMVNSEIPLVLDALNLTANVHNKGEIQRLRADLAERDRRIAALEERLERLEGAGKREGEPVKAFGRCGAGGDERG